MLAGHTQREYRSLWERYYKEAQVRICSFHEQWCSNHRPTCPTQSIVFVVDSADKLRMVVAKDELDALLAHEDVSGRPIPLLIFANKTDKASALPLVEVMSLLGLQSIANRAWHVQPSNALTGEGVDEGIEWLAERVAGGGTAAAGGTATATAAAAGGGS